jgi:hypothetical protein
MHGSGISIWFFIGISLFINGILIAGAGFWEIFHPPAVAQQVVLFSLHANAWWGLVLMAIGALYCVKFKPGRA